MIYKRSNFLFRLSLQFRNILACLHFNENVKREARKRKDGKIYYKVTWQKFKQGGEVVREVAVPQTYGIYQYINLYIY